MPLVGRFGASGAAGRFVVDCSSELGRSIRHTGHRDADISRCVAPPARQDESTVQVTFPLGLNTCETHRCCMPTMGSALHASSGPQRRWSHFCPLWRLQQHGSLLQSTRRDIDLTRRLPPAPTRHASLSNCENVQRGAPEPSAHADLRQLPWVKLRAHLSLATWVFHTSGTAPARTLNPSPTPSPTHDRSGRTQLHSLKSDARIAHARAHTRRPGGPHERPVERALTAHGCSASRDLGRRVRLRMQNSKPIPSRFRRLHGELSARRGKSSGLLSKVFRLIQYHKTSVEDECKLLGRRRGSSCESATFPFIHLFIIDCASGPTLSCPLWTTHGAKP
eukprot:COSAG02_NODE_540_length_20599_cov_14.046339_5_plen_335_part_00